MSPSNRRPVRRTPPPTLAPVHPNQGVQAQFRRRLLALIDEMQKSVVADITALYPGGNPQLAQDAPQTYIVFAGKWIV